MFWRCPKNHPEFPATVANRALKGSGCPYCTGRLPIPGETDLDTTHPHLAQELVTEDPATLKAGTNRKVLWLCPEGHEYSSSVVGRALKGTGCSVCVNQEVLSGFNDLATTHPTLAAELRDIDPTTITPGSNKKVWWVCPEGHEWPVIVAKRTKRGYGCPTCSNRQILIGYNDLATTHPEIAKELVNVDPTTIHKGTRDKVTWVCPEGHQYPSRVYSRAVTGNGCPKCSGREAIVGATDLSSNYPQIAAELVDYDPKKLTTRSGMKVKWMCLKGHTWSAIVADRVGSENRYGTNCPECVPMNTRSRAEIEISDFISIVYSGEIRSSDRKVLGGLELDIYLPDLKIGIEYNGIYWHSEKFQSPTSHKEKLDLCSSKDIRLISIWEDDYRDRKEIVHRMLAHKLGVSGQRRVSGSKTRVVELSKVDAFPFLEENHIQGKASGSYYLGLREKATDELVAVMVLKRTKDVLSLDRYATSAVVLGGQSKILSWVDKNITYSKMITFADQSLSDGGLYTGTGWVQEAVLPPDYRYLVNNRREHKFNYRLKRFREDPNLRFEEGLTERELANLNGLHRVYDHGKVRYARTPNK